MALYYDNEYKENNADLEAGFPLTKSIEKDNIDCRVLEGGKAATIIHKGPYKSLGKSYEKILKYIHDKNYKMTIPTREVYIRGPGIIFRGNPEKYITEIHILIN